MAWTGIGWAWTGPVGERASRFRVWTVSAVVAGDDVAADGGVVLAADLDLAAAQMCLHLDDALTASGRYFLLATREADTAAGEQPTPARLLAPVRRDPGSGAATYGDWVVVDDLETALRESR
ncbi:hypothetical protein GPX89_13080 [Nocardia sp. ET3-3]|uniref:Uncharacterized protein n=1 Tax=Nocardia terrae TaxID=2675851 RepID=A0A7K1UV20_9NOCA|nr:hypothetical protein [Nocardia terrae]MVU78175.1 hypothetical protein [Nocardia terrae]